MSSIKPKSQQKIQPKIKPKGTQQDDVQEIVVKLGLICFYLQSRSLTQGPRLRSTKLSRTKQAVSYCLQDPVMVIGQSKPK